MRMGGLPFPPTLQKMKLPGGLEFRPGSRSFPLELCGPYRVRNGLGRGIPIVGTASVLGSEEPLFHLLAPELSPQSLGTPFSRS